MVLRIFSKNLKSCFCFDLFVSNVYLMDCLIFIKSILMCLFHVLAETMVEGNLYSRCHIHKHQIPSINGVIYDDHIMESLLSSCVLLVILTSLMMHDSLLWVFLDVSPKADFQSVAFPLKMVDIGRSYCYLSHHLRLSQSLLRYASLLRSWYRGVCLPASFYFKVCFSL